MDMPALYEVMLRSVQDLPNAVVGAVIANIE